MAQVAIEGKTLPGFGGAQTDGDRFNFRRNFAFALFSGAYLGCFQHLLYNIAFTRLFGSGQSLKVATRKVAADYFVTTPFLYLPIYYASEYAILQGDPSAGVSTYFVGKDGKPPEMVPVMKRYTIIWPAFHLFNFTVTPPELRIAAIACVSFLWLTILSNVSHQDMETEEVDSCEAREKKA